MLKKMMLLSTVALLATVGAANSAERHVLRTTWVYDDLVKHDLLVLDDPELCVPMELRAQDRGAWSAVCDVEVNSDEHPDVWTSKKLGGGPVRIIRPRGRDTIQIHLRVTD